MKSERYHLDPDRADADDPDGFEGIVMNTGTLLPLGDALDALEELDFPLHELLAEYERCESPYFRYGSDMAEGLWRLPGWDILATTRFENITPYARKEGITDLPYTTIMVFRRSEDGQTYRADGQPLAADAFAWVMDQHRSSPQNA